MSKTDHQNLSVWVLVHAEYRKGLRYLSKKSLLKCLWIYFLEFRKFVLLSEILLVDNVNYFNIT